MRELAVLYCEVSLPPCGALWNERTEHSHTNHSTGRQLIELRSLSRQFVSLWAALRPLNQRVRDPCLHCIP